MLITFFSCEQDSDSFIDEQSFIELNSLEKSDILNLPFEDKVNYKRKHLLEIAKWISEQESELSEVFLEMNSSSENQIIYIEDFHSQFTSNKNVMGNDILRRALNAFKLSENENWYPVIFLRGDTNVRTDKTFLAIEDVENGKPIFKGYEITRNLLRPLDYILTPENVGNNNLYVIELESRKKNRIRSNGSKSLSNKASSLVLEKMKIKDLKEGWPGRSEISFQGFKLSNPTNATYNCGEYMSGSANCYDPSGNRIVKLYRSWKNDLRTYNFLVKNSNNGGNDIIYYIIFEEDSFPAPEKTIQYYVGNGGIAYLRYRSWDSKYDSQLLTQQQANNFSISNSAIEYNLKLK